MKIEKILILKNFSSKKERARSYPQGPVDYLSRWPKMSKGRTKMSRGWTKMSGPWPSSPDVVRPGGFLTNTINTHKQTRRDARERSPRVTSCQSPNQREASRSVEKLSTGADRRGNRMPGVGNRFPGAGKFFPGVGNIFPGHDLPAQTRRGLAGS